MSAFVGIVMGAQGGCIKATMGRNLIRLRKRNRPIQYGSVVRHPITFPDNSPTEFADESILCANLDIVLAKSG